MTALIAVPVMLQRILDLPAEVKNRPEVDPNKTLATVVFGGLTPWAAQWLVERTETAEMPGIMIAVVAVAGERLGTAAAVGHPEVHPCARLGDDAVGQRRLDVGALHVQALENVEGGEHDFSWDGKNVLGSQLPDGGASDLSACESFGTEALD